MIRTRFVVCGLCLACLGGTILQAGEDSRRSREYAMFVSEGTFRGFALPGVAANQHEKALENWKKLYEKEAPRHHESEHFLLYGTLEKNRLRDAGPLLDKTLALAMKTLEMEGEATWTGKLMVFLTEERSELNTLVRILEKRRAEDDEQGTFDVNSDFPHIAVGPPVGKAGLPPEQEAGTHVAAALLTRKVGRSVPHWVQMGFGRATVLRAGPPALLTAEHNRVAALVRTKRGLKDVLGRGTLDNDDTLLVRASLMEYLAYSGRTAKFMPFIKGFQPSEEVMEPTVQQALDAANLSVEKLDTVWQNWVRMGSK